MRRKWIQVLIGALLITGITYGYSQYMKSYQLDVTMMDTWKPIRMIRAGELLTSGMVHKVSIPTIQHMEDGIVDLDQIIGKRAIVPIGETEEILLWKIGKDTLYPTGDQEYIGFNIDFVGAVNNMIRRGDKVVAWVEYSQPKVYDSAGKELDQSQQAAILVKDPTTTFKKVYTKELIDNLTVAYIKDQDGHEVTDGEAGVPITLPGSAAQRDEDNAERYRQNASGLPSYITFIMTPDQYDTFAMGAKDGTIRLGLPNSSTTIGTISKSEATDNEAFTEAPSDSEAAKVTPNSSISISPNAIYKNTKMAEDPEKNTSPKNNSSEVSATTSKGGPQ